MKIEIDVPDDAPDTLRRLGVATDDQLDDLREALADARFDAEDGQRQLARPVGPRAAEAKERALRELAEAERTLLKAECEVLRERIARLEAAEDDRRTATATEDDEGDDTDDGAVPRSRLYEAETGGWVGR